MCAGAICGGSLVRGHCPWGCRRRSSCPASGRRRGSHGGPSSWRPLCAWRQTSRGFLARGRSRMSESLWIWRLMQAEHSPRRGTTGFAGSGSPCTPGSSNEARGRPSTTAHTDQPSQLMQRGIDGKDAPSFRGLLVCGAQGATRLRVPGRNALLGEEVGGRLPIAMEPATHTPAERPARLLLAQLLSARQHGHRSLHPYESLPCLQGVRDREGGGARPAGAGAWGHLGASLCAQHGAPPCLACR